MRPGLAGLLRQFTSPPVNTVAPAVTGSTVPGATLSVSNGTWTGTTPIVYTYQWKKNGVDIGGQTANTYVSLAGDAGSVITCPVTANNGVGPPVTANSNGVTIDSIPTPTTLQNDFFAGSGTVTSGGNVTSFTPWAASAGRGDAAVPISGEPNSHGPTVGTLGTAPALVFDRTVPHHLATPAWGAGAQTQPFTRYIVCQCTTTGGSGQIMTDGLTSTDRASTAANDAGNNHTSEYSGVGFNANPCDVNTAPSVLTFVVNGVSPNSKIYLNGVLQTSGSSGTQTPTGMTIGSRFAAFSGDWFGFTGKIGRIVNYDGAHSQADVTSVVNYLRSAHGV